MHGTKVDVLKSNQSVVVFSACSVVVEIEVVGTFAMIEESITSKGNLCIKSVLEDSKHSIHH